MEALFAATEAEHLALFRMLAQAKDLDRHHQPEGYNIGINHGQAGGQSVPHLHTHLIPRYRGDKEDARGGVRWVIFIIGMNVQPKTANDPLNSNNESGRSVSKADPTTGLESTADAGNRKAGVAFGR
jgi:diadenosine tetraphosphate (Ap4A) HIT family hydrolase